MTLDPFPSSSPFPTFVYKSFYLQTTFISPSFSQSRLGDNGPERTEMRMRMTLWEKVLTVGIPCSFSNPRWPRIGGWGDLAQGDSTAYIQYLLLLWREISLKFLWRSFKSGSRCQSRVFVCLLHNGCSSYECVCSLGYLYIRTVFACMVIIFF